MNINELQPIKQRYGIIGNSENLNRALDIAIQVANTDLSVLIEGENGVGKEMFPRIIHDHSSRKHQKYFAINCGSIPSGTIESELFGHMKGAFTGAVSDHAGYFETADKGTLFLDEVGELPLEVQVKLLRVLETGEFIRMGSNEVRHSDVRIVAATNVKMKKAIRDGKFREDLYYRLATIPITVPPLRERGNDILLLFRKFASDIAEKYRIDPISLTDDGKDLLLSYKWPGNIRQLRNIVENLSITSHVRNIDSTILQAHNITNDNYSNVLPAVVVPESQSKHSYANEREMLLTQLFHLGREISDLKELVNDLVLHHSHKVTNHKSSDVNRSSKVLDIEEVEIISDDPEAIKFTTSPSVSTPVSSSTDEPELANEYIDELPLTLEEQFKQRISDSLNKNHNNRRKTASELGISERTLYRKIKKYGLEPMES